jgi:sterol 3beta-glucosyltransferase
VYVGFGSIGNPEQAAQTTRLVVAALQRSGQRGLLATGWDGMSKAVALPADMHILESAPHSWLFPRMAAVVHHGGAATTAAGLRAGVPSVIVPHGNDQFAWGRRMWELGVAAKPISRKKLTAEALSEAINLALSEQIRAKASGLGQKIQEEDGAGTAARAILDCFG